jgi:hypothetical protein
MLFRGVVAAVSDSSVGLRAGEVVTTNASLAALWWVTIVTTSRQTMPVSLTVAQGRRLRLCEDLLRSCVRVAIVADGWTRQGRG